jgi:hypothetical protein
MAVVFTQEMSGGTREMIEAVTKEMDVANDPPKGMIIHTASEMPGGVRIVDVWESREDHEAFGRDRLHGALETVAKRMGVDMSTMPEPTMTFTDTFDVKMGR